MDRVHHDLSTEWHNWLKRHGITQFYLFRRCETRQDQDLLFQTYLLLLHPKCSTVLHTGLLLDLRTEPAFSHLGVFARDEQNIQFYIPHRIRDSVWYIVDAHNSYMFKVHWIQINISYLFYMGKNLMKSPNSKEVGREIGNIPLCKSTHWPLYQADKGQLGSGRKFLWVYSAFGPEKPMIKHYKWVRIMLVVLTTLPHWSPWLIKTT